MGIDALLEVLIGLLQVVAGLPLVLVAERIPPNPLIGLRVSYTMTSKKAWTRLNRIAGSLIAGIGVLSIVVGLVWGIWAEALLLVIGDVAASIVLLEYSRSYAEKALISEPSAEDHSEPIQGLRGWAKALVAVVASSSTLVSVIAAVKLGSAGLPGASIIYLALGAIALYTAYLSLRRPEAYAYPWLGAEEYRLLALLVPVSTALVATSAGLILFHSLVGVSVLVVGISLALLAAAIVIRAYSRKTRPSAG